MIDDDGRVRLMDFGLARREIEVVAEPRRRAQRDVWRRSTRRRRDAGLHGAGTARRRDRGPRRGSVRILRDGVGSVVRRATVGGLGKGRMSAHVRRALARGLSVDPKARWPDVAALLHVLARDRRDGGDRGRGQCSRACGARGRARTDRRRLPRSRGAGDLERRCSRASVHAALVAHRGTVCGVDMGSRRRRSSTRCRRGWTRAGRGLRAHAAVGRAAYRAGIVHRAIAGRHSSLSSTCCPTRMHDRREGRPAVAGLPSPSPCSDVEYLAAAVRPPDDDVVASQVEALRQRLGRARALDDAGEYAEGFEVAEVVLAEARRLEYAPVVAESLLQVGRLADSLVALRPGGDPHARGARRSRGERPRRGRGGCRDSARVRRRSPARSPRRRARVGVSRAGRAATDRIDRRARSGAPAQPGHRPPDARRIRRGARALPPRVGDPRARVRLRITRAWRARSIPSAPCIACAANTTTRSRPISARSRFARRSPGRIIPARVVAAAGLGAVYFQKGDYDEAIAHYERALAILENALGPDHARVADARRQHRRVPRASRRSRRGARAARANARDRARHVGPDHPDVAISLENIGNVHYAARALRRGAVALPSRALAIREKALGPDHPHVAVSLANLARLCRPRALRRALSGLAARTADPGDSVRPRSSEGRVDAADPRPGAVRMERLADARATFERVLAARERTLAADHPDIAESAHMLGVVATRAARSRARDRTPAPRARILDPRRLPTTRGSPPCCWASATPYRVQRSRGGSGVRRAALAIRASRSRPLDLADARAGVARPSSRAGRSQACVRARRRGGGRLPRTSRCRRRTRGARDWRRTVDRRSAR